MKIYTLTGDDGTTSLAGGRRVPKHCLRVEAYGSVDELITWIGLLRSYPENNNRRNFLIYIQDQLMASAASLSNDPDNNIKSKSVLPDSDCIKNVEAEIDRMDTDIPELRSFVLPGGNVIVSNCHIARCVCRRAERSVLRLRETEYTPDIIVKFLNRLSDYLFVLSRKLSLELNNEEIKWPF